MTPIVVLIGRTNVGKSSLFNILTKTRNALVSDYAGLTRDRQYGICEICDKQKITLIDTAGLDLKEKNIEKKSHEQSLIAMKEADLILFIVDARAGLMPQDIEISQIIRKESKKTILIINKIDGIDNIFDFNEFYALGIKETQKVSASHNQGIDDLFLKHLTPWTSSIFKNSKYGEKLSEKNENKKKDRIKVAFIGRPNVGKSTLINSLLKKERMITCNIPGTTLDSISIPIDYDGKNYVLIDTAGSSKKKKKVNKFEFFSIIKTLQTIQKSNIVLLIIDASNKISNQDLSLADFTINAGKGIIIIINKWDLLNFTERENLKKQIKDKFKFVFFSKTHFISALHQKGIFEIFKSIYESYTSSQRKISTSKIMKTMHMAIKKHQPPIVKGRRIKLKYAHLGSSNPPKIIIHGNQLKFLSSDYKRYLLNFFYHTLKIKGTPIQIQFKDNVNPYARNKYK